MARLTGNYFNFIGGLNTESSVLNSDPTSVTDIVNCTINREGSIQKRAGLVEIDSIGSSIVPNLSSNFEGFEWKYNNEYVQIISSNENISFLADNYPAIPTVVDYTFSGLGFAPEFTINKDLVYFQDSTNFYKVFDLDFTLSTSNSNLIRFREEVTTDSGTASSTSDITFSIAPSKALTGGTWARIETVTGTDVKTIIAEVVSINGSVYTFDTTDLVVSDTYTLTFSYIDINYDSISALLFAQNRLFMVTETGDVFFSQVNNPYKCYTEADPFSANDSSVVATDGGILKNTGIGIIYKVMESFGSILLFADNGVWQITGQDGVFAASELSLNKVYNFAVLGRDSIKEVDGGVVFATNQGILVASKTDAYTTSLSMNNITDAKIKSYWNSLPISIRETANVVYDDIDRRIIVQMTEDNNLDLWLIYDITLQCWYKYKFAFDVYGSYVSTVSAIPATNVYYGATDTDLVITASGDEVVTATELSKGLRQLVVYSDDVSVNVFNDAVLVDLESNSIESYFSSAHQTYKDIFRKKTPSYMKVLFERSESDIDDVYGRDITKGSCKLRTSMNFASDPLMTVDTFGENYVSNNDWGRFREIYPKQKSSVSIVGNRSRGYSHVMFNHKLLGRGDVLQFNFLSESEVKYYIATETTTSNPRSLDGWVECTTSSDGDYQGEWSAGTFSEGETASVTLHSRFKVLGWSCDIIASDKASGGV